MSNVIKSSHVSLGEKKLINFERYLHTNKVERNVENDLSPLEDLEEIKKQLLEEAEHTARERIKKAKEEAKQIINRALQEAELQKEQIIESSRKQGYDTGYHEGKKEADTLQKQANQIMKDALEQKEQIISDIEPQMIDLIISIIGKLLNDSISLNPDTVLYLIRKGLNHVTEPGSITIKVSQEDYSLVVQNRDDMLQLFDKGTDFHIVKDSNLQKGDCIIETSFGSIDCRLEDQFNGIKKELYHILKNGQ